MSQFQTLSVRELIVGDPNGSHFKLSAAGLLLYAGQHLRASLFLCEGSPELLFYDGNGQERLGVCVIGDGEPEIRLSDGNGHGRVSCGVLAEGTPCRTFSDAQQIKRLGLELQEDGTPEFTLQDQNEQKRAELTLRGDQDLCLIAYDADGREIPATFVSTHHQGKQEG